MRRAMVVVDVQRDFCEGGSLAVAGGSATALAISETINNLKEKSKYYDYYVATKDFHLPGHDNGGHFSDSPDFVESWPVHCVQGTDGALFHPSIAVVADLFDAIFYKGQGQPSYSGFEGRTMGAYPESVGHSLNEWLTLRNVEALDIVGIATDYCVKATALDAIREGYVVRVPFHLTAAVGGPDAVAKSIYEIHMAQDLDTRVN